MSQRSVRYLRNRHVDGAVVVSHHLDDAIDNAIVASGLPNVFIGRPGTVGASVHHVDTDNVEGGRIATEHLIARGRRRIGTIAGPLDMSADIDGIFVASDLMAVGALGVLASRLPRPAERPVGGLRQF